MVCTGPAGDFVLSTGAAAYISAVILLILLCKAVVTSMASSTELNPYYVEFTVRTKDKSNTVRGMYNSSCMSGSLTVL